MTKKRNEYSTARNRDCTYVNLIKHLAILLKWYTVFNKIIFFYDKHIIKQYNYLLNSMAWLNCFCLFELLSLIWDKSADSTRLFSQQLNNHIMLYSYTYSRERESTIINAKESPSLKSPKSSSKNLLHVCIVGYVNKVIQR